MCEEAVNGLFKQVVTKLAAKITRGIFRPTELAIQDHVSGRMPQAVANPAQPWTEDEG